MRYLILIGLLLFTTSPALAWGPEGHAIVAEIADHYLTPTAHKKVKEILAAEKEYGLPECPVHSISDAANWPDALRQYGDKYKNTFVWHYDDIPYCGDEVYSKYCPNEQCLSAQTVRFEAVLSNDKASAKDRLEALKFVMHFIGDAHQPLHAIDNNDAGGNLIPVSFLDNKDDNLNLHHVWDVELVERAVGKDTEVASAKLEKQITPKQIEDWDKGTIKDWLAESHDLAKNLAYKDLPAPPGCHQKITEKEVLGDAYYAEVKDTIVLRLEQGGVRLAKVLNDCLK